MRRIFLRDLFLAVTANALLVWAGHADAAKLTINMTADDRQFLIDSKQNVAIAFASPVSDADSVVVSLTMQPIADRTEIAFDADVSLYVAYGPVAPLGTVKMQTVAAAAYGQAYRFNGTQVSGGEPGVSGYLTIYFDAPAGAAAPLITGVAAYVYDRISGKPAQPSPTSVYTLTRFEARTIPKTGPTVWVFIASDVGVGSVLPLVMLKPAADSMRRSAPLAAASVPAMGRYLPVNLDAAEQNDIHFDSSGNQFAYGAH